MADKFEDNIEHQLSNFSLPPSPLVWREVEAALHPPTKKRVLIWWWLPLLLVVVGGLGYWVIMDKGQEGKVQVSKRQEDKVQESKEQEGKEQGDKEQEGKEQVRKEQGDKKQESKVQESEGQVGKVQDYKKQIKQLQIATIANDIKLQQVGKQQLAKLPIEKLQPTYVQDNKHPINRQQFEKLVNGNDSSLANTITTNKNAIIKDSVVIVTTKTTDLITIDSAVATKKVIPTTPTKKHQWLLTAGGGLLDITTGIDNDLKLANSASVPQAGGVQSGTQPGTMFSNRLPVLPPNNGLHFHVGIARKTSVSKQWYVTTGLQYQYLQSKQTVGQDSVGLFSSGNLTTKTNYAHWLQVPVSVGYIVNPAAKNQVSVTMGGSLAWAFSKKWLITDIATETLYYNPSLNNNMLLGLHGGLSYHHADKYTIALLAAYTTTPIHKKVAEKYHYLLYHLQISTPINFSKKSLKK